MSPAALQAQPVASIFALKGIGRSAAYAATWWTFLFLVLRLVAWMSLPDPSPLEGITWWLIQPIPLVSRAFSWMVDSLGPQNLAEPASMFLGPRENVALLITVLVVSFSLLTLVVHALRSVWAGRHNRSEA